MAVGVAGWSQGQTCPNLAPTPSIDVSPNDLFPPVEFPAPRGTPLISPHIKWDHSQTWDVPTAKDFPSGSSCASVTVYNIGEQGGGRRAVVGLAPPSGQGTKTYTRADTSPESPDHYLADHSINSRVIFPATGYLCLVWRTLAHALDQNMEQTPVVFEDVTIHQATILPKTGEAAWPGGVRACWPLGLTSDPAAHRLRGPGGAASGGFPRV